MFFTTIASPPKR